MSENYEIRVPAVGRRVRLRREDGMTEEGVVRKNDAGLSVGGNWYPSSYFTRTDGRRWQWEYVDPKPQRATVPRRATGVGDLKPGMRVRFQWTEAFGRSRPGGVGPHEGVLRREDTYDGFMVGNVAAFSARNWGTGQYENVTIIADPAEEAKPEEGWQLAACTAHGLIIGRHPCEALSAGKLKPGAWAPVPGHPGVWQAKYDEVTSGTGGAPCEAKYAVVASGWRDHGPPAGSRVFGVSYPAPTTVTMACDPRCTKGAPCRRTGCKAVGEAAHQEELAHVAWRHSPATAEALHAEHEAAIVAQWEREREAPLPTLTPWAGLRASVTPWPYASRVRR